MSETALWRRCLLAAGRIAGVVILRNSVGQGWVGKSRRLRPGEVYRAQGGEVIIADPRPLHAGLFKGSGDGVGWRSVVITDDMVGQRFAQFVSVETKVPDTGRMRPEQRTWDQNVRKAGGISIIARHEDDLLVLADPRHTTPG